MHIIRFTNAETEEELKKIEALKVTEMSQAIKAYRHVATTPEFHERERLRSKARHDEAQALKNAEKRAEEKAQKKWETIVAQKDATLAEKDATLAQKEATLAQKDATLAQKEATLAKKDATLAQKDATLAEKEATLAQKEAEIEMLKKKLNGANK